MSIEVKNLSFSYGEHEVLHDVSFSVAAGEYLSILGPNGVGKSTLFRCVLGLLRDYTGSVTVEGRDAKSLSIREAARSSPTSPRARTRPSTTACATSCSWARRAGSAPSPRRRRRMSGGWTRPWRR